MTKKLSAFAIAALLSNLACSISAPARAKPTQDSSQRSPNASTESGKIKAKVAKIGMGKEVTVKMRGGDEYHGSIQGIDDDTLKLYEVDLKKIAEFKYADVKKVESGYGHSRDLYGRRIPPRKHQIGLAIALAAILVPVVIVGVSLGKH